MNDDGARYDSGFDDGEPFRDTPEAGGISLESALRDFGPAALDDLIPRLQALAGALTSAHARGAVHGALHPSKVIIHDDATYLIAGDRSAAPYVAPEVADGDSPSPASDQFALAAIAYEWLFGRRIDGPAERPVDVRTMPGVDRAALSKAFTRALSPEPEDRFTSCAAFCDTLAGAVVPELPLLALEPEPDVDDVRIATEEPARLVADFEADREPSLRTGHEEPNFDAIDRAVPEEAVASWNPAAAQQPQQSEGLRFGGFALILATIVGAIFGFAAGYMARPRALQSAAPPPAAALAPGTESEVAAPKAAEPPVAPTPAATPKEAPKEASNDATAKPAPTGRLLVRSIPGGARITVDGVAKGSTPAALTGIGYGTHDVVIARDGYASETRRVSISEARPSRTVEVRLISTATAARAKAETTKASKTAKPATTAGSIAVESRPVGATVTINGRTSGKTPLIVPNLAPGEYRVVLSMPGYRIYTTTVRVVAGERVRAAASLTAQEQE